MSRGFCGRCNRVRLTSAGVLKPCLSYEDGVDLLTPLRGGASDEALLKRMRACIDTKPRAHCFNSAKSVTERKAMNEIGG